MTTFSDQLSTALYQAITYKYSDDQPRDDTGKWAGGGGSSSGGDSGSRSSGGSDSDILGSGNSKATRGEVKRLREAAKKWQTENNYTTPPNASDIIKAGVSHGGFTKADAIRVYSVYRDNKP